METNKEEQFNKSIETLKNTRLSLEARNTINKRLLEHIDSYTPPPIQTPYFTYIHFSYKTVSIAFVLVFSISIGTTYASFNSLPGDVLYPIKTNFTEPIIKLTKKTKQEKEAFDLVLADTRISEIEELIKKDDITEAKLDANLALFEKHLDEREKDSETENKKDTTKKQDLTMTMKVTVDSESEIKKDQDDESDSRINKYRDLIISKPSLNNFYETKAKFKLDSRRKKVEQKKENETEDSKKNSENETSRSNKDDTEDIEENDQESETTTSGFPINGHVNEQNPLIPVTNTPSNTPLIPPAPTIPSLGL